MEAEGTLACLNVGLDLSLSGEFFCSIFELTPSYMFGRISYIHCNSLSYASRKEKKKILDVMKYLRSYEFIVWVLIL
jgi:hypothetical protein